jgi:diguanylate cyclase (GGDEF)-like protein
VLLIAGILASILLGALLWVLAQLGALYQQVGRLARTDGLTGGEEFALLLPECGIDDALEIAERLRTAQPEGTCSIGVADWDGREDMSSLVARADRALYAAKEGGRNRCWADRAAVAASAAWTPAS